ncbi:MAG: diguanylate cyclase [Burkholderiales bacterium]
MPDLSPDRAGSDAARRAARTRLRAPVPAPCGTVLLDGGGRISFANAVAAELFGQPLTELIDLPIAALIPDLPLRDGTPGYNAAFVRFWFADGRWVPFRCADGARGTRRIEVAIESCRLQDRRAFVLSLRQAAGTIDPPSRDLSRLVDRIQQSADAVLIADVQGVITDVNPAFESLTGFGRDDALGQSPRILSGGEHPQAFYEDLWAQIRAGREFRGRFINRKKTGEIFHADETIRPFVDEHGQVTHYVATVRDVSATVRSSEALEYLAHHDSHTGLVNRRLFLERLRHEMAGARRSGVGFALLCLDVDRFKSINDHHGHAAGDALLMAMAHRLTQCVRQVDTVARLGGDEFAVILVHATQPAEVAGVADKILRALGEPVRFDGVDLASTVSIGIALFPGDGSDEHSLLRTADAAMYRAKAGCGNSWWLPGAVTASGFGAEAATKP